MLILLKFARNITLAALIAVCSCFFGTQSAHAQNEIAKFPEQYSLSPKGVNLQTGLLVYSVTDFDIGDLQLTRSWGNQGTLYRQGIRLFGETEVSTNQNLGWNHNLNQGTRQRALSANDDDVQVIVGGAVYTFYIYSNTEYGAKTSGSTGTNLRRVGNEFRFTDRSGTEYAFMIHPAISQENFPTSPNQVLRETTKPDGTVITYTYLSNGKLQEARSSRGYVIHFDYDGYGNISAACGINLALTTWAPATSCAAATLKTSYQYNGAGNLLNRVTDVSSGQTQIFYEGTGVRPGPTCFTLVNSSTCALTNVYATSIPADCPTIRQKQVYKQITATGETWTYCFEPPPSGADEPYLAGWPRWSFATVVQPDGLTRFLTYDRGRLVDDSSPAGTINYKYPGAVIKGTVGLATYTFDFMETRPGMVTHPDRNVDYYIYNQRGSIMLVMRAPKGGQEPYLTDGQPALPADIDLRRCCMRVGVVDTVPGSISIGQAFLPNDASGTGCGSGPADSKRCDKPVATIDGRGLQTDYTYDPAHGGVLTETGPAVNGIRPEKRYTYVQRSAWIATSGGFAPSGAPIWVLATQSYCRTSAAAGNGCALAGDEVVTTYEYGADGGPNNLLLKGMAVAADGLTLRTCYSYDWRGNKISETNPRAGLAVCQ